MNGRSWQYADLNAIAALEAENFSDPLPIPFSRAIFTGLSSKRRA